MMTTNTGPAKLSAPLTPSLITRFKPAKIFKDSVNPPPPAPTSPGRPPKQPLPLHITGLSFDDHGDTLLTAAEDETFRVYNCKTGKHATTLYSKKYGVDLPRFTHKASTIIYASTKEDDTIRYHSLHDNKYLQYFKGHKQKVVSLEVSPLDDTFMSSSLDSTVRLWDLRTPNCRGLLNLPSSAIVAYDSSGLVFAVCLNTYRKILLYDMKNFDKEPFLTVDLEDSALEKISYPPRYPVMTSMSFSNNGKHLLVGTAGDFHYVLDAFSGEMLAKLAGFTGLEGGKSGLVMNVKPERGISGEEVCWTADSKFVISGSGNGKVFFWDADHIPQEAAAPGVDPKTLYPTSQLDGHAGSVRCVKFNPRYQMMATASSELAFWLPDASGEGEKSDDDGKGKEKAMSSRPS